MSDLGGWGKFYSRAFTGSMMGAGPVVFSLMGYCISHALPPDGRMEINPVLLAVLIGTNQEEIEKAIVYLTSPDPRSRSGGLEGRRLEHISGFTYRLVNWIPYREGMNDEARKEYFKLYQRDRRAKEKAARNQEGETLDHPKPPKVAGAVRGVPGGYHPDSALVLKLLNRESGCEFQMSKASLGAISARLSEPGVDLEGVTMMVKRQAKKWRGTKLADYLRPSTLFEKEKFGEYYAAREMPIIEEVAAPRAKEDAAWTARPPI